jgi:glucose-6-phosphate-specific signal transduction histidine kinase
MNNAAARILWTLRYLLGWTPFFLLYTIALHATNSPRSWTGSFFDTTFYFLPGIVLGLGVWWFVGQMGRRRHHWGKFIGIHLIGGLVFSIAWHGLFLASLYLSMGAAMARQFYNGQALWMMLIGLLVYGVLAGMCSVSSLAKQVRERDLNAAKAESLRVRAEMEALRGQLDPHFLFNTLHSITALVREDSIRAEEALLQFGDLMRFVISAKRDGADEIPLGEELAFVDRYLGLEKLRLGERLEVERSYTPEALACWIPVFTVQPLVENAIRHAIAPHREGGTLKLSAQIGGNLLEIRVEDNGPGAEPTMIEKAGGVGIGAIRQRLKLRHGEAAALNVDTALGRGFRVAISLPVVHNAIVDSVS